MAFKALIASQTGAVSASLDTQFSVKESAPATLSATALVSAETAIITYSGDNGVTFAPAFSAGVALVLSVTVPQVRVIGEGIYRVSKGATVSPCAINIVTAVV